MVRPESHQNKNHNEASFSTGRFQRTLSSNVPHTVAHLMEEWVWRRRN
jgi:hypothetical protein